MNELNVVDNDENQQLLGDGGQGNNDPQAMNIDDAPEAVQPQLEHAVEADDPYGMNQNPSIFQQLGSDVIGFQDGRGNKMLEGFSTLNNVRLEPLTTATKADKLLGKKRKAKKEPSDVQKMLTAIKKQKMSNKDVLRDWLNKKSQNLSDDKLEMYFKLGKLSSDYKVLSMPKVIANKKMKIYFSAFMGFNYLTTDKLYWEFLLSYSLKNDSLMSFLQLDKLSVCSVEAIKVNDKLSFAEYYIEDNNPDISAPVYNSNMMTYEEFANNFNNHFTELTGGDIRGVNYTMYGRNDCNEDMIIYKTSYNGVNVVPVNLYTRTVVRLEKGSLKYGLESLVKGRGVYFIDKTFNVETFCPSTLVFGPDMDGPTEKHLKITFSLLYELEIDKDLYLEECVRKNNVIIFDFMFNWTNLEDVLDLIRFTSIYLGHTYGWAKESSEVKKIIEEFAKVRNNYVLYRKHYYKFCSIVTGFIDCFKNKVNFDKLMELSDKVLEYIQEEEVFDRLGDTKSELIKFLDGTLGAKSMSKFLTVSTIQTIKLIYEIIKRLETETERADVLEDDIRTVGTQCFKYMADGEFAIVNQIRSKLGFLGDVTGGQALNVLANHLKTMKNDYLQEKAVRDNERKAVNKQLKGASRVIYKDIENMVSEIMLNNQTGADDKLNKIYNFIKNKKPLDSGGVQALRSNLNLGFIEEDFESEEEDEDTNETGNRLTMQLRSKSRKKAQAKGKAKGKRAASSSN